MISGATKDKCERSPHPADQITAEVTPNDASITVQSMMRTIIEWIWRIAILAAVLWVGWQVVQLREDLINPDDEPEEPAQATALMECRRIGGQPVPAQQRWTGRAPRLCGQSAAVGL